MDAVKIELRAVIELDARTFINLKLFMEKALHSFAEEHERKELSKFMAILNDYDLEGF